MIIRDSTISAYDLQLIKYESFEGYQKEVYRGVNFEGVPYQIRIIVEKGEDAEITVSTKYRGIHTITESDPSKIQDSFIKAIFRLT